MPEIIKKINENIYEMGFNNLSMKRVLLWMKIGHVLLTERVTNF